MKETYQLPEMETRIHLQVKGEETHINWVGDFLYRRPNLRERSAIELMRTRLNGDLLTIDPEISAFNEALAVLRFTLKEYPDWWKDSDLGGNLYDANIVLALYEKALQFEAKFKERLHGDNPENVKAGKDEEIKKSSRTSEASQDL